MDIRVNIKEFERDITDILGQFIRENIKLDGLGQLDSPSNLKYLDEYIEIVVRRVLKDVLDDLKEIARLQRACILTYGARR